ncbi:ATP-dependent protease Clp, ATPase subunit [Methylacidimicrobium sp. AP8]|uniref:AAA family ATPase n=1 Tax=Methylacidimicrobium sp. AP8 TaxID=2730359 RepID=UPI0018C06F67|nr:AAA family ATPase [Methylacidimicrobium sp. AP8]CAB4243628.1 ATP-dependent protease Clp, ATPase subunit [Methylacidimicrobium sp. AP8]
MSTPQFPDAEEWQRRFQEMFRSLAPMPAATDPKEAEKNREAFEKQIRSFSLTPKELKAYLDRFVIQQEEAKRVLSVAVCDHYNHVRAALAGEDLPHYVKQNVLLVGPSGVGKTYLVRCLAERIGVPMVRGDATKFSETGYVGGDVEDLVRELVQQAGGDVSIAQYGIIYLDEIDKLAGPNSLGRDVSGRGVQANLLKLLEETEVPVRAPYDLQGQIQTMLDFRRGAREKRTINTRHILFLVSGAFTRLPEIVARRRRRGQLGFRAAGSEPDAGESVKEALTADFIEYGLEPEFIGRLPVRVFFEPLSADDLFRILRESEGSILRQYVAAFQAYGISLRFTEGALRRIAQRAAEEETGARGLMTICERILRPFRFECPGTGLREVLIDEETVEDPEKGLQATLTRFREGGGETAQEVEAFAQEFFRDHELRLRFQPEAVQALRDEAGSQAGATAALCRTKFKDFPFGLRLIRANTGQDTFTITPEAVKEPEAVLNRWVLASYSASAKAPEGPKDQERKSTEAE